MYRCKFTDGVALLKSELHPSTEAVLASHEYRQDLAASLLYKVFSQSHQYLMYIV